MMNLKDFSKQELTIMDRYVGLSRCKCWRMVRVIEKNIGM